MRGIFAVSMIALLGVGGCASRESLRALQTPAPAPHGLMRFEREHPYRDAIVLEWVGGVSQQSYLFAEPNQRVIRGIVQSALADSGAAAGTSIRARYGLRVEVTEAQGPSAGADAHAELAATYILVDRASDAEVWRREVRTPGVGYFLAFNESDWQTAWFIDPILAAVEVGNPFNFLPFASNSAADHAQDQGLYGDHARARAERFGPARAARANYAATATNVNGFLVAFAADHDIELIPVLPCWGSAEVEAKKRALLASGRSFATDNCAVGR